MQKYVFRLSDGRQIEETIEAKDNDEAFGIAMTALSLFAGSKFPPPEHMEVIVMDADRNRLATMRFTYTINLMQNE